MLQGVSSIRGGKVLGGVKITPSTFNDDFAGIMVWFIEIVNDAMFWRRVGEPARRKDDFEGFKCKPCDDDHSRILTRSDSICFMADANEQSQKTEQVVYHPRTCMPHRILAGGVDPLEREKLTIWRRGSKQLGMERYSMSAELSEWPHDVGFMVLRTARRSLGWIGSKEKDGKSKEGEVQLQIKLGSGAEDGVKSKK